MHDLSGDLAWILAHSQQFVPDKTQTNAFTTMFKSSLTYDDLNLVNRLMWIQVYLYVFIIQ